jgi:hypothetical protein
MYAAATYILPYFFKKDDNKRQKEREKERERQVKVVMKRTMFKVYNKIKKGLALIFE